MIFNDTQINRQLTSDKENWLLTLLVGWRSGWNLTFKKMLYIVYKSFINVVIILKYSIPNLYFQGVVPGFNIQELVELLRIHGGEIWDDLKISLIISKYLQISINIFKYLQIS